MPPLSAAAANPLLKCSMDEIERNEGSSAALEHAIADIIDGFVLMNPKSKAALRSCDRHGVIILPPRHSVVVMCPDQSEFLCYDQS